MKFLCHTNKGQSALVYPLMAGVRKIYRRGKSIRVYDGKPGAMRLIRAHSSDGSVAYYEGEPGAERMVSAKSSDGSMAYYEGEPALVLLDGPVGALDSHQPLL